MAGLRLTFAAGLVALAAGTAFAESPVRVVVTFTEVRTGSAGNDSRNVTIEGKLLGGNRVADFDQRARGGGRGGGGRHREGKSRPNESTFGGDVQPFEGRGSTASWRVGDNNTLVRTLNRRNDIETATIALTGTRQCRATVTFRLKPGRTTYVRHGGRDSFADVRAENVACSISD